MKVLMCVLIILSFDILSKNLPLTLLKPLRGKKFYFHEVIGFKVISEKKVIGIINKINDLSPQPIFEIKNKNRIILVPIHNDFIIKINRKVRSGPHILYAILILKICSQSCYRRSPEM